MEHNEYYRDEVVTAPAVNGHNIRPQAAPSPYELRSEEVQEIMGRMPHWLVRNGTSALFMVIILLFTGAYFIHYPDIIITNASITSSNPPVRIIAQTGGKIQRIFVRDNQAVGAGESVCLLENPANYNDVVLLKALLNRLDTALLLPRTIKSAPFKQQVQLGELQAGYVDLYQSIHQYLFFREKNFFNRKVGQLQSQLEYQGQLNRELQNRDTLLKQQLTLETKRYLADSSLVVGKVIAPLEFENSKKELISKQINADEPRTMMLQNQLQQVEYQKTITDLQQQKLQQENDLQQKVRENVKRLQGQLKVWEQKYLMKSPVEGKAAFFKFWKENQYVSNGEAVLMIVPPVQNYIAKASLPVSGAGKVKVNQKVLIKLASYPFEEFGMIRGTVAAISPVAMDTAYSMEIKLAEGLTTTVNKQIPPQPELLGYAEVLTSDKNILERLFEKIWRGR